MTTIRRPSVGAFAFILSTLILVSCGTATPSDSPSASPSTPTAQTPTEAPASAPSAEVPSSVPSSAPSAAPTATPGVTPTPGSLAIAWHRSADVAAPRDSWWSWAGGGHKIGWTKLGGTYVLPVDTTGYDDGPQAGPQMWLSKDLLHWHKATIPVPTPATGPVSVTGVTLGGPGLMASGTEWGDTPVALLWTSTDGETWTIATDKDTGLSAGQLWLLGAVGDGMVSFVDGPVDVTQFQGDPFDASKDLKVLVAQGGATAFLADSDTTNPVTVWQSIGSGGWQKLGTLPKSNGAFLFDTVHGPHGWVVLGCDKDCSNTLGWSSTDGLKWQTSKVATFDNVNALIADQSGFIAVGQRVTGTGCAVAESEIYGETWTSSDGRTWRTMKDVPQFSRAAVYVLIAKNRTLFGVGQRWVSGHAVPTVWSAALPANSASSGPGSTPPPPPSGQVGCGD